MLFSLNNHQIFSLRKLKYREAEKGFGDFNQSLLKFRKRTPTKALLVMAYARKVVDVSDTKKILEKSYLKIH